MKSSELSKGSTRVFTKFSQISERTYSRVLVGLRAFRKGGIRLEREELQGKIIVHNYGHGGAGITLAPATAEEAVEEFIKIGIKPSQKFAIMGSGIAGIVSAIEAARVGFDVTVYSKRVPEQNPQDVTKMIASQIAPGYFLSHIYEYKDVVKHNSRATKAFKKYLEYKNKYKAIRWTEALQEKFLEDITFYVPQFLRDTMELVDVKLGNSTKTVLKFKTLQIHLISFLQQLLQECKKLGIKFVDKKFSSLEDVLNLQEKYIINCLAFTSKQLFNDKEVYGRKGHLLEFKNTGQVTEGIFGFGFRDKTTAFYVFPEKILVGLTIQTDENSQLNPQSIKDLKQRTYAFMDSCGLGVKPKL